MGTEVLSEDGETSVGHNAGCSGRGTVQERTQERESLVQASLQKPGCRMTILPFYTEARKYW